MKSRPTACRLGSLLPAVVFVLLLAGCASSTDYRSWERGTPVYYVKGGDTLYSIAVANSLDWRTLAKWNGISDPRHLRIGQKLRLSPPDGGRASKPSATASSSHATPVKARAASGGKKDASTPSHGGSDSSPVRWAWPLDGRVLHRFSEGAPAQKGVIIAAAVGRPVRAAAEGRVVYSGDGLPGYGNLVIVKHDDEWLSAYAYNQSLLVSEGDGVESGQTIARVGPRDHRKPDQGGHLLFQIRRRGTPVDPERHLP